MSKNILTTGDTRVTELQWTYVGPVQITHAHTRIGYMKPSLIATLIATNLRLRAMDLRLGLTNSVLLMNPKQGNLQLEAKRQKY